MERDMLVPGNICHAPNEAPEPDESAFCSRFADFIIEAIVGTKEKRKCDTLSCGMWPCGRETVSR